LFSALLPCLGPEAVIGATAAGTDGSAAGLKTEGKTAGADNIPSSADTDLLDRDSSTANKTLAAVAVSTFSSNMRHKAQAPALRVWLPQAQEWQP